LDATLLASILREQPLQLLGDGIRFRSLCLTVEARVERLTISIFLKSGIDRDDIPGSTEM
jgi:hypothetical protein